jgi:hypothetical protein
VVHIQEAPALPPTLTRYRVQETPALPPTLTRYRVLPLVRSKHGERLSKKLPCLERLDPFTVATAASAAASSASASPVAPSAMRDARATTSATERTGSRHAGSRGLSKFGNLILKRPDCGTVQPCQFGHIPVTEPVANSVTDTGSKRGHRLIDYIRR